MDEAQTLFGRAGNAFKLAKQWKESGDAYYQQGQTLEKMGDRDEGTLIINVRYLIFITRKLLDVISMLLKV